MLSPNARNATPLPSRVRREAHAGGRKTRGRYERARGRCPVSLQHVERRTSDMSVTLERGNALRRVVGFELVDDRAYAAYGRNGGQQVVDLARENRSTQGDFAVDRADVDRM